MEDVHDLIGTFRAEYPDLYKKIEASGQALHLEGGPLDQRVRALLKVAISASSRHLRALETHIVAAREAGVTDEEIVHALLLVIPTCGFPSFMEAFRVYKEMPTA